MAFIDKMENILNEDYNTSITENGAVGYEHTNSALLDINFKVPSYRKVSLSTISADFKKALLEDEVLALKWAFYLRDVREGLGERRSFRAIIAYLGNAYPEIMRKLISLVPEYGRFDDLYVLFGTEVEVDALSYIWSQIEKDCELQRAGKPISLLAKWLPSENASSAETKAYAKKIRNYMKMSSKDYRKYLSSARNYLKVVERNMSANNWREISYEAVPSRANLNYNNAFLRHDEDRRRAYLDSLSKGETKINAGTLYPYDIVHKYTANSKYGWSTKAIEKIDDTLEALWKALPNKVTDGSNTIVVADGSGSMTSPVSKSGVTALDVANSLAIYFAERAQGEFKNKYITFSGRPQLVNLNGKSLRDNIEIAFNHNEVANTNVKAVFELILKTAVNNHMTQEEIPQNILIVSDMEFDSATCSDGSYYSRPSDVDAKLFKVIAQKYAEAGYKLPRLVFWNVNSRTNTIPVTQNENGVILIGGFSVNLFNMVLSNETDPYKALIAELNKERYNAVAEAIAK